MVTHHGPIGLSAGRAEGIDVQKNSLWPEMISIRRC